MNPIEHGHRLRIEARRQLLGLRIVRPAASTVAFRYGYLPRLLDDRELAVIEDPAVRAATRSVHLQIYRGSLRLLGRDIGRMLRQRRKLMEAKGEWRFEVLISETARIYRLLWKLRVAGMAHALHVPAMAAAAGAACSDIANAIEALAVTSVPAVREA
jgi:hypothetical protein